MRRNGPEPLTDPELLALELAHPPVDEAFEVARTAHSTMSGEFGQHLVLRLAPAVIASVATVERDPHLHEMS